MLLRMSRLFLRTLREDPADAEVPSHRLLVRAGYIRRAAPGGYTWLPLGWRVYQNVERIVREEMDAMGAQEVHFPALLPREPYDRTNRWTEYGDDIFRLQDRKGGDYLLGPTHEEMFTLLVKDLYSSYKDLPLWLYQIQTKFRDEQRPRAGLLRGREFVMKDSYSFDVDDAGPRRVLQRAPRRLHQDLRPARPRLRHRLGDVRGHGRLAKRGVPDAGRERRGHVRAVHVVRLRRQHRGGARAGAPGAVVRRGTAAHVEDTPDTPTIETLVGLANGRPDLRRDDRDWTAADTLKNVLVKLRHPGGKPELLAIGLPGDRDVDMKRLEAQVHPSVVEPFTETDFDDNPGLVRGYIGPGRSGRRPAGRRALPPRPARGRGHPVDHGSERAGPARVRPGGRSRLHRRRDDRGCRRPRR